MSSGESSHSLTSSITLPSCTVFKFPRGALASAGEVPPQVRFGSGLVELGTPHLRTRWEILWCNTASQAQVKYEKEAGLVVEQAQFSIVVVLELLVADVQQIIQYSNPIILPVGPPGSKTDREAQLTGSFNVSQSLIVSGGQTLYAQMYYQILSAEGPEKPAAYENLNAISIAKAVPIQLILGYTQTTGSRDPSGN